MAADDLGDDFLVAVYATLDTRTLLRAASVCQRWKRAARDPLLWDGTGRVNVVGSGHQWTAEAVAVYGRYATTFDLCQPSQRDERRLLGRLVVAAAPLVWVAIRFDNFRRLCQQSLPHVQVLTVRGKGSKAILTNKWGSRRVFPRLVAVSVDDAETDWVTRPAIALESRLADMRPNMAAFMFPTFYPQNSFDIVYRERSDVTLANALTLFGIRSSPSSVFVSYHAQAPVDVDALATSLLPVVQYFRSQLGRGLFQVDIENGYSAGGPRTFGSRADAVWLSLTRPRLALWSLYAIDPITHGGGTQ
jgi:hypothetical protein